MDTEVKAAGAAAEAAARKGRTTLIGMACMAASALLFMSGNAVIKLLAESGIPPVQTVFFRALVSLILLTPFALMTPGVLKTDRLVTHGIRGIVQAASMICFFSGIVSISLVEGNALEFTSPIFATLFAVLFMGEAIRARRLIAMACGFLGALIALRPGFAEINQGHGFILVASILWAAVLLMIRSLSTTESALTQSLYIGIILTPIAGVLAALVWVTPDWHQLALLAFVGCTATLGQYLFAQAFRFAEMSAVLPLDFTKLIWSSIIGLLIFHTTPDAFVLLGGTIIFVSGAYITIREAQIQRRAALSPSVPPALP
ncbi:Riboflavin transporter [Alphaproteobacteria bacterium SO-S41]|nr:Riboflavin transporter [Alphaproteobacteria bacterium SO-S41]